MISNQEKISILVVGVSGAGKTTLIEGLRKNFEFTYISFGKFVVKFGLKNAQEEFHRAYKKAVTQLVLMDEHLEFPQEDEKKYLQELSDIYKSENVRGIIFLQVDAAKLYERHEKDRNSATRHRVFLSEEELHTLHLVARKRVFKLQKMCNLRLLLLNNASVEESIKSSSGFLDELLREEILKKYQTNLALETCQFDLEQAWNSYWIMNALRKDVRVRIDALLEKNLKENGILFDPQDLEHQVLFYLTTYDPTEITEEVLDMTIADQYSIIEKRLKNFLSMREREYLFRGLTKLHTDLNVREADRLTLYRVDEKIFARGTGREYKVVFKEILDEKIIKLYTEVLHYIHCSRSKGQTFGLFFEGDMYPFAVQSIETPDRDYKKDALLFAGVDPAKTAEITRMYTLPGSPKNIASVMDGLVRRILKNNGYDAMITTVMPAYAQTKGTTVAGGMSRPFLSKPLSHSFFQNDDGLWEHVVNRNTHKSKGCQIKQTHPAWRLPPVIEVIGLLKKKTPFITLLPHGEIVHWSKMHTEKEKNIDNVLFPFPSLQGFLEFFFQKRS